MILTGSEIAKQVALGGILIDPFNPANLGPNSYDLTLGTTLKMFELAPDDRIVRTQSAIRDGKLVEQAVPWYLDPLNPSEPLVVEIPANGILLQPGRLYLGHTVERAGSDKFVPRIDGRSSLARLGVMVHLTAGFGDLGFNGQWTLAFSVLHRVLLYPGMRVCQISFHQPVGEIMSLYRGKYLNSEGVVESRISRDREFVALRQPKKPAAAPAEPVRGAGAKTEAPEKPVSKPTGKKNKK